MPNVIPFLFAWQPETVMLFPCRSTLRFVIFAVRISLTVQLREVKYGITGLSAVFAGVLPLRFPFIWNMVIAFRVFGTAERSQLSNAAANLSAIFTDKFISILLAFNRSMISSMRIFFAGPVDEQSGVLTFLSTILAVNTHDGILSLFFVAAAANGFRCLLRCFTACIIAIFMPTSFLRLKSVFFRPDDIFWYSKNDRTVQMTDRFPFHFSGMPIPDSDISSE